MYFVADASTPATWIYFVVLLFLGSFFVINLSLVIINDAFQVFGEPDSLFKTQTQALV